MRPHRGVRGGPPLARAAWSPVTGTDHISLIHSTLSERLGGSHLPAVVNNAARSEVHGNLLQGPRSAPVAVCPGEGLLAGTVTPALVSEEAPACPSQPLRRFAFLPAEHEGPVSPRPR